MLYLEGKAELSYYFWQKERRLPDPKAKYCIMSAHRILSFFGIYFVDEFCFNASL